MELQDWRKEPRKKYSNEFKFRMVELASQPGACVAQIARENGVNDNVIFKWLRLWQNEGRISRRLPVTTASGAELLPVEITPDETKEPVAALTPLLSTPSQSPVSTSSCKVEFRHGNMTLENPSPELLTVLLRELTGRGRFLGYMKELREATGCHIIALVPDALSNVCALKKFCLPVLGKRRPDVLLSVLERAITYLSHPARELPAFSRAQFLTLFVVRRMFESGRENTRMCMEDELIFTAGCREIPVFWGSGTVTIFWWREKKCWPCAGEMRSRHVAAPAAVA